MSDEIEDLDQPTFADVDPELDLGPDWEKMWVGMPAFQQKDLAPWQTVFVHFRSQKDRDAFSKLIGQTLSAKTQYVWHPKAEVQYVADKRYVSGAVHTPRHPIYIISKGRWESRLTSKALEEINVPYHIVIEPQELSEYSAVIDPKKILTLPFSNLGQGSIPARNWVWDHALSVGAVRHWILDDNIRDFYRMHDNQKIRVGDGTIFKAAEDFVDRYENVTLAGFQYEMFAPRRQAIPPFILNTRIYSCILIDNACPHRWRGRYNEDTDLSIRVLKDGACTVLFNAFLAKKIGTMRMKGGNTDELYKGAEALVEQWAQHVNQCKAGCKVDESPKCVAGKQLLSQDGRWLMAESLREQHPDVTTIERKWDRWQHQVDYRPFRRNELRLRSDVVIKEDDNYGFQLEEGPPQSVAETSPQEAKSAPEKTSLQARTEPGGQAKAGPSALDLIRSQTESFQPVERVEMTAAEFKQNLEKRGHKLLKLDDYFFITDMERLTARADEMIRRFGPAALLEVADEWDGSEVTPAVAAPEPRPERAEQGGFGASDAVREGSIPSPAPNMTDVTDVDAAKTIADSFFEGPTLPRVSLADVLGPEPPRVDPNYVPDEPPDLSDIKDIVLNFVTDGVDWASGARPGGVTVSTLDGGLTRFLPFRFRGGGNLDEAVVKRWYQEQIKHKHVTNANTRFEVHMSREWGVDLEGQGCTVSDVMHYAALLDDHRKRFALDVLIKDYLHEEPMTRLDERDHLGYSASEAAPRERYTAEATARLRNAMWPLLDAEELQEVRQLEDEVIYPLVEMEKNGALLDVELLDRYSAECTVEHQRLMMEISEEVGFAFEHTAKGWGRLFDKLGLPGSDSFAEDVVGAIDHPLVKKGHYAAQIASLNSKTFAAYRQKVDANGILRYDINQLRGDEGGTVSGRFSIGYVQQVPNFDNHDKVFGGRWFPRQLFKAAKGQYLEADAAQIEYRLFAHYANNAMVLQAYKDDPWLSFHKMTWAEMKKYKADMSYTDQKTFNFAKMYGAKMVKLAIMMGYITKYEGDEIKQARRWDDPRLKQIKEIESAYKRFMPEGDMLLDRASHLAKPACDEFCKQGDYLHKNYKHRGFVKTLLGRRSRFTEGYRTYVGLNRVIQGTAADAMKKKLVELHRQRKQTGFLMRLTVHDAVGGDAQEPDTQQKVAAILDAQSFDLKVPILWATKVGESWAEAK